MGRLQHIQSFFFFSFMINNALYKGDNELMIYWLLYKLLPNVMILSVRGRR